MSKPYGLGRIGSFEEPVTLRNFIEKVKSALNIDFVRTNCDDPEMTFDSFAVVTGSGASMWKACKGAGVKVLLTGDMKHHDAIDAREAGIVVVDAGHFETEKVYMDWLGGLINKKFKLETVLIDEKPSIVNWR
jgi:putative NIF3 family GTP cyclohydrolase 1 type 2